MSPLAFTLDSGRSHLRGTPGICRKGSGELGRGTAGWGGSAPTLTAPRQETRTRIAWRRGHRPGAIGADLHQRIATTGGARRGRAGRGRNHRRQVHRLGNGGWRRGGAANATPPPWHRQLPAPSHLRAVMAARLHAGRKPSGQETLEVSARLRRWPRSGPYRLRRHRHGRNWRHRCGQHRRSPSASAAKTTGVGASTLARAIQRGLAGHRLRCRQVGQAPATHGLRLDQRRH